MEFKIQTLNKIAKCGLNLLDRDIYEVASDMNNPDAYLVRSQDMHSMNIPESVKAVARAGAGTNNIPIPELTEKGIVVFNTPGANANAVKELVILSLLIASRPVVAANKWANELAGKGDEIPDLAEKGKSQFVGPELKGKTLEEANSIIENYERMINELPYNEEVLGELNIYNEVYKQPSRKNCALLPIKSIKKIVDSVE